MCRFRTPRRCHRVAGEAQRLLGVECFDVSWLLASRRAWKLVSQQEWLRLRPRDVLSACGRTSKADLELPDLSASCVALDSTPNLFTEEKMNQCQVLIMESSLATWLRFGFQQVQTISWRASRLEFDKRTRESCACRPWRTSRGRSRHSRPTDMEDEHEDLVFS